MKGNARVPERRLVTYDTSVVVMASGRHDGPKRSRGPGQERRSGRVVTAGLGLGPCTSDFPHDRVHRDASGTGREAVDTRAGDTRTGDTRGPSSRRRSKRRGGESERAYAAVPGLTSRDHGYR